MEITIFGATGGTGIELVRQSLGAGHRVTVVVRDPSRLPTEFCDRVEVVTADVFDPGALEAAVKGRDAVLTAMGSRTGLKATTVCSDSAHAIAVAMEATQTRRLLMVSTSGQVADAGDGAIMRTVLKPLVLQPIFKKVYDDMRAAERHVAASDLDWTFFRPSKLTNADLNLPYRTAIDRNIKHGLTTSRADLAHSMLRSIDDAGSIRHSISVAS
jgi:putative NADH-flavin reductase